MINLSLLSSFNLDSLLSTEVILYLEIRNNNTLCTQTRLRLELLQYAKHTLGIAMEAAKVIGTENGRSVLQMLTTKREEVEEGIKRAQTAAPCGFERLMMVKELPCSHLALNTVCVQRSRLLRAYGQAKKIRAPETCIIEFGKLVAEMGASSLTVCNAVLELSGNHGFRTCEDRLFRMDFLMDAEFEGAGWFLERARDSQRREFLARLRQTCLYSSEQLSHIDAGSVYVALSPWDRTHCLGYLILNRDILKTREHLEAEGNQRLRAEVENTGGEWLDAFDCKDPMLYLEHIEVAKEIQSCGVGTRMIKWVMKMAESKGVREIALGGDQGAESWPFWQKLGFEPSQLVNCVSIILSA